MIAGCPKCGARYRVDADKIGADGAKLRCTKCSAVFLVRAPQVAAAAPVAPETTEAPAAPSPETEPMPEYDRARLVLIADPDEARGKASAAAVDAWGLQAHLVHDGVEAMMAIQRLLPSAVVLDAALPKMFGFQVCEVVKRNESLRETVVVLVGAIHHQGRYRRDPADLYGADVYVEQPDLPEGLEAVLREGGMPMGGAPTASMPQPTPNVAMTEPAAAPPAAEPGFATAPPPPAPEPEFAIEPPAPEPEFAIEPPTPTAETASDPGFTMEPAAPAPPAAAPALSLEEPAVSEEPDFAFEPAAPVEQAAPAATGSTAGDEDPEKTEERERAKRLARIAVSEMLLYQPEKFEQASRDGNLEQALDLEIQEARALLRQRISEEVRAEADFVMEELERVAAERSAQG